MKKTGIRRMLNGLLRRGAMVVAVVAMLGVGTIRAHAETQVMPDGGLFDPDYYAKSNPDVVAAFGSDANSLYYHYCLFGKNEGRLPYAPAGAPADIPADFDASFYAYANPDVVAAFGTDPAVLYCHYVNFGKAEGRFPNAAAAQSSRIETRTVSYEQRVVELVNAERAKAGLPALTMSDSLNAVAKLRATELEKRFSHTRPDGRSCFTAYSECGANYGWKAENIAAGYMTPEDAMNGWMNSSGHRANILDPNYKYIGVGYYSGGGYYGTYWSQNFGR